MAFLKCIAFHSGFGLPCRAHGAPGFADLPFLPAHLPPGLPAGGYEGQSFSANKESSEMMGDESAQQSVSFVSGSNVMVSCSWRLLSDARTSGGGSLALSSLAATLPRTAAAASVMPASRA